MRPNSMIKIGGRPILWLLLFSAHGINEFILRLGHHGYLIKVYAANYFLLKQVLGKGGCSD